jgi:hypothetical protein
MDPQYNEYIQTKMKKHIEAHTQAYLLINHNLGRDCHAYCFRDYESNLPLSHVLYLSWFSISFSFILKLEITFILILLDNYYLLCTKFYENLWKMHFVLLIKKGEG